MDGSIWLKKMYFLSEKQPGLTAFDLCVNHQHIFRIVEIKIDILFAGKRKADNKTRVIRFIM